MTKRRDREKDPLLEYRKVRREQDTVSTHKAVLRQEEHAAKLIGGRTHLASGALHFQKSDCSSEMWQVECKQTGLQSLSLKVEWLDKITEEAMAHGKKPMLHLRFLTGRVERDWVLLPERELRELLEGL